MADVKGAFSVYVEPEQVDALLAALREITNYSCYGAPWDAYVAVKRIAREALDAHAE